MAGLALAWIAAIALVGPLLVEREIEASQAAAAEGDLAARSTTPSNARSIEPWAASPYVQLGLLAERQANTRPRSSTSRHAIEREDRNWQWYYLRSRVEHEAGDEAAARGRSRARARAQPARTCLEMPMCG